MGKRARTGVDRLMPELRDAAATDIPSIVAIEAQSFADPWSARAFDPLIGALNSVFIVAHDEGVIRGYVVAIAVENEGEILNVAVGQGCRRTGVGARLLDEALDRLKDRGVASVYLEVRDANAAARGLYDARGFREVGRRRNYYRHPTEDALILVKVLMGSGDPQEGGVAERLRATRLVDAIARDTYTIPGE